MKIKKVAMFSLVLFSMLFVQGFAGAQVSSAPMTGLKWDDLLSVNIYDAKIEKQTGNNIELSFNISNRDGIQPQIVYAVSLVSEEGGVQTTAAQKVYDEVIILGAGESVYKNILFQAPGYLNGSFKLVIEARNKGMFKFGSFQLEDDIKLTGSGERIAINPGTCFLTVNAGDSKYKLSDTVDVTDKEVLSVHCKIKNLFKSSQEITPVFTIRNFSKTGSVVAAEKMRGTVLQDGEELDFTADVPKVSVSQLYSAVLSFADGRGESVSAPLEFSYIISGEIVNMLNLSIEKGSYRQGENARIFFLWGGVKNFFASDKVWRVEPAQLGEKSALIDIYNKNLEKCAPAFKRELGVKNGSGVELAIIPIKANCDVAKIQVQIMDDNNKVFADSTYDVLAAAVSGKQKESQQAAGGIKTSAPDKQVFFKKTIAVLLTMFFALLLLIGVIFYRKKNGKGLLPLLMLLFSLFAGVQKVEAMGFYGGGGFLNFNPNPPGFSMAPIPCPASSGLLGCGPVLGGGLVVVNCAPNTCVGSTCWSGLATLNGTKSCDNGCAANTCSTTTCWNSYKTVNGTKSCDNGCAANTCIGATCNNGSNPTTAGTKLCDNGCAATTCSATTCNNGITTVAGTKVASYGPAICVPTTVSCTAADCGRTITAKTYFCTKDDLNGCGPSISCNSNLCPTAETIDCPACALKVTNWKEVAP